jgi:hypothetical protein
MLVSAAMANVRPSWSRISSSSRYQVIRETTSTMSGDPSTTKAVPRPGSWLWRAAIAWASSGEASRSSWTTFMAPWSCRPSVVRASEARTVALTRPAADDQWMSLPDQRGGPKTPASVSMNDAGQFRCRA